MKITNINQILPAIQDKPEFIVMDKGWYQVVDYVYQQPTTFDSPEAMECRGIKFCKEGLILARPFKKFFNVGEAGTSIDLRKPHTIYEKLDGSMVHATRHPDTGHIYLMTRKGHTDVAKKAERVAMSQPGVVELCSDAIAAGFTPIFEYIGPENRILLRYESSKLVLIAMRKIVTGTLLPTSSMLVWSDTYCVPIPEVLRADTDDQNKFVAQVRAMSDIEGFVVYSDQHMAKIKTEEYVIQHRALDDLSSKKKVVALCCQGFADDVLAVLDPADKAELEDFNYRLQYEVDVLATNVNNIVDRCKKLSRKDFAVNIVAELTMTPWLKSCLFGVRDGGNATQLVLQAISRGGYRDLDTLKWRGE
jgi:RNA ligase